MTVGTPVAWLTWIHRYGETPASESCSSTWTSHTLSCAFGPTGSPVAGLVLEVTFPAKLPPAQERARATAVCSGGGRCHWPWRKREEDGRRRVRVWLARDVDGTRAWS